MNNSRESLIPLDDYERIRYEDFKVAVNKGLEELERGEGMPFTSELRELMNQNAARKAHEGRKLNSDVCP